MKTLQFISYPITNPQHGGQLRCAALKAALRAGGIEAESMSVFDPAYYQEFSELDFPVRTEMFRRLDAADRPWDVMLSKVICDNEELYSEFLRKVTAVRPDCYIFEQPWLWPAMRKVFSEHTELVRPVVYSSQNVEYDLVRSMMLKATPELNEHDRRLVDHAFELEKELCERADLVICCTQKDLETFRNEFKIGRSCCFLNGINPPTAVSEATAAKYAERYKGLHIASFVGSAHPPNADGLEDMLGKCWGFLPPDCRLVIVGGVANLLRLRIGGNVFRSLNASRSDMLGCMPQEDLDAILARSELIVLPITTGGGSNLKTAEALVSGKPILSTKLAFRGYDEFASFPGVYLTDDPVEFRRKLRDLLLNGTPAARSPEQVRQVEKVLWKNLLKDYPEMIRRIVDECSRPA